MEALLSSLDRILDQERGPRTLWRTEIPFHGMPFAAPRSVKMPLIVDSEWFWTEGWRALCSAGGSFHVPVFDVDACAVAVAVESVP